MKKRKEVNRMKKVLALVIAVLFSFSATVIAFAEEKPAAGASTMKTEEKKAEPEKSAAQKPKKKKSKKKSSKKSKKTKKAAEKPAEEQKP
ncbi:MAG TPA: hypothetical protein VFG09_01385 [Thermodesulfovibrionales bacterium]|jgi:uncharacterized protein YxeA|nr:hypothetical protein [Thermodesulfovibrionales bacterium]